MSGDQIPDFDIRKNLSMLFATPLVLRDWADSEQLNESLAKLVLAKEKSDEEGYGTRSNAGGWQSGGNLIKWPEPCIQTLKNRIEAVVFNLLGELVRKDGSERTFTLLIDSWANINRNGDYNVVHTHPNCMWSGVYYVQPGVPDKSIPYSGLLEILDPREAANYIQIRDTVMDAREFVDNVPGRMLLWPSWLKHWVHPFAGEGERISIAFNVNVIER
jgi:uncharacterized protein (TIGR02466 family)